MSRWPPKNGRRALITGITGQDGSYLAELLLARGYEVWGMIRRASSFNTARIDHIRDDPHHPDVRLRLVFGDLTDASSLNRILSTVRPHEVYNLGAQSHVQVSFSIPEYTADVNALGAVRLLEGVRKIRPGARFYQASSSELFGNALDNPQTEQTPFCPRSPYAASKAYSFHITRNYREAYGLFAVNGILFNHESPRRGETFVTRKITRAATRIKHGLQDRLYLGNLEARRDWGFAGDYVAAIWQMLQAPSADDYVLATGESHSVREFCELAFAHVGMDLTWRNAGAEEVGIGPDGDVLVAIDPTYYRPSEVDYLVGDATKAQQSLGWKPTVTFEELVKMMIEADLQLASASSMNAVSLES